MDTEYQWFVSLVMNPTSQSKNIVAVKYIVFTAQEDPHINIVTVFYIFLIDGQDKIFTTKEQ